MQTRTDNQSHRNLNTFPFWLGACLFAAIAMFFLWEEHQAHIMGALPYVLLLLCPALHLLMHRGHGGHRHAGEPDEPRAVRRHPGSEP